MPTASIYKSSLILLNPISWSLVQATKYDKLPFQVNAKAIMGYRTQYFKYLWRYSCLSLRINHWGRCTKSPNCSNKIKMPKSTTGCRIKSFTPTENMNVETLRLTRISPNIFSQVSLKLIQKSASLRCSLPPALMFSFLWWFLQTSNSKKDCLIDSCSIYNLIGKFLTH